MKTILNLALLRGEQPTVRSGQEQSAERSAPVLATVSRRRVLGVAGMAAFGLSPLLRALGASVRGPFEIRAERRRVRFLMDGDVRWTVDTRMFGGRPRIELVRTDHRVELALHDATFPGTELPADFRCTIRQRLNGWRMDMQMELGHFRCEVPFESWLSGRTPARAIVDVGQHVCSVGSMGRVALDGMGHATLAPDWSMVFEGDRLASFEGLGATLPADRLRISLLAPGAPSLMEIAPHRRSLVALDRGGHDWRCAPTSEILAGWSFAARGNPFDQITLEAGESRSGSARGAMIAEGTSADTTLALALGASEVPLRCARLALANDGGGEQSALLARWAEEPAWIHGQGGSISIADRPDAEPFELVASGAVVQRATLRAPLIATYLPVGGGIGEPAAAQEGAVAHLLTHPSMAQPADATSVVVDPQQPQEPAARLMVANPRVPVIRPRDLLYLQFEFLNMSISTSGSSRQAVRGSGQAVMVVHFPPQNIAEQAFFERDTKYPVPAGDQDGTNNEPDPTVAPILPVKARFSGPSRLAFNVPSSVSSIPLNIDALLRAMIEYEPSLVPTALPPAQYLTRLKEFSGRRNVAAMPAMVGSKALGMASRSVKPVSPLVAQESVDIAAKEAARAGALTTAPSGRFGAVKRARVPGAAATTQQMSAARSAMTSLVNSRESIEDTYMIDLSDVEIAAVSAVDIERIRGLMLAPPRLQQPKLEHTAIESPFRLVISPNRFGRWTHSLTAVEHEQPVSGQKFTELWHTRLGVSVDPADEDRPGDGIPDLDGKDLVDEQSSELRTIRAVWANSPKGFSTDYASTPNQYDRNNEDPLAHPYRMSLDEFDRHNIVHLSANYYLPSAAAATSCDKRPPKTKTEALPIKVDRLMLSSLGSWMNVRGAWDPPPPLEVEEWRHRGTMGRDNYVRVVYKGYLFPFGHRASLIKITERKLQATKFGNIAYLRQRMYIVVRQPEKTLRTSGLVKMEGSGEVVKGSPSDTAMSIDRQFPYFSVQIRTLITPNLDDPTESGLGPNPQSNFLPKVNSALFRFRITAVDLDKQETEFSMPLAFIGNSIAHDSNKMLTVRDAYDARTYPYQGNTIKVGTAPMTGQKVAYATSDKLGDTSYETDTILLSAEIPKACTKLPPDQPNFYPVLKSAALAIPAIKHLAGQNARTEFAFSPAFLKHEFSDSNAGDLLLQLAGTTGIDLDFSNQGDRSGGLVQPNMSITGLTRKLGPVAGDVNNIVKGDFDPKSFFESGLANAKLFGVLSLWDIIPKSLLDKAPKFVTNALTAAQRFESDLTTLKNFLSDPAVGSFGSSIKTDVDNLIASIPGIISDSTPFENALTSFAGHVNDAKNALPTLSIDPGVKRNLQTILANFAEELKKAAEFVSRIKEALNIPEEIKITLDWDPPLQSWPSSKPLFVVSDKTKFRLGAEVVAKTNFKSAPQFDLHCVLENFDIDLIAPVASFIVLKFTRLGFFASSAMKTDVVCDFGGIQFVGVLSFVETLRSLIPLNGFSDPPALDITEKGIDASFSVNLPNIAFGVFALSNMSLGAGFTVPFIGDPLSFRFNFCTRENPFTLQISFIGGGGFFGITIDPTGVQLLEAALEAGVTLSMDFGVASGSVHAMVGMYFKMQAKNCELSGYFRIGGEVDVLGIICVSIELNLSLTYEFETGKMVGRATLTISIEICFFSIDVEISCEKKFAGSNGDPTFAQLMEPYEGMSLAHPGTTEKIDPWAEYVGAFVW